MQPVMSTHEEERFPTIYVTDGNLNFDVAKGLSHSLQMSGQVRRYILVGIGYPGDNPWAGLRLRFRDLTPDYRAEISSWLGESPIQGIQGVEQGKKRWHGASDFLAFMRNELTVLIDETYPTMRGDRAYFGHSLGGGFGLHALFTGVDLFDRYVLSSPSISYEGVDHTLELATKYIECRKRVDAKLVMTVGGEEEFEPGQEESRFVSSFYRLAALLRKAQVPGLDFRSRVFDGETHMSVWPISFSYGVQAIFGSTEWPPPWRLAARANRS